jgi:hypothetical protein
MTRQEIVDIGLWCALLLIIVFLIWIIKQVSGASDHILILTYYGCGLVALIVICLLILLLTKHLRK